MAMIPTQSKYPNRAGYLQLNTNTNEVEVFSDGKFKSVTENNEYFNIYKNSKLLFESTTDFYGLGHFVTDIATMKQYIIAAKGTQHGPNPNQIVKINLATGEETVFLDGTLSNTFYALQFPVYHNNIPYSFIEVYDIATSYITGILILNDLTGDIIKQDNSRNTVMTSYITINNEIYYIGYNRDNFSEILKYSFDTNEFTVLNTFTTEVYETEPALGKINGKFFAIYRTHSVPGISFSVFLFNDDWTVKKIIRLDLGHPIYLTPPYIFRKGSKLLFTFISRRGNKETPGNIFTYEITEENDNFNFKLKNIFPAVLTEDVYYTSTSDCITVTGYYFPAILPFSKTGLILVEDERTTPSYKTRLYQLDYDNDISVDYTNF